MHPFVPSWLQLSEAYATRGPETSPSKSKVSDPNVPTNYLWKMRKTQLGRLWRSCRRRP
jgi:hypothetical protein